jgi:ABC-type polysaccharide/polyol phosphate transport system ATPase subunit
MSEIDVRLEDVWKQYRMSTRRGAQPFWALQGVTVDVVRGSTTGIIGRNGAGKSTLFKLLAGITTPTRGRITLRGRLAALIEVASGFHPELTGRENVLLSGAILGMTRRDVVAKLASIVDFAGIGAFIDTPVKWYSSGMYVRLGFSVAAHLDPDIMLVDEVLAVGDAEFQARCMERVQELRRRGVTMLIVSHDLTAIAQLCDRAILLEAGRVAADGLPAAVIADYHRRVTTEEVNGGGFAPIAREGALKVASLLIDVPGRDGVVPVRPGDPLRVTLRYTATRPLRIAVDVSYYSADGRTLMARASTAGSVVAVGPPGGGIEFRCPMLPLAPGSYHIGAVVRDADSSAVIDWWDGGTTLRVAGDGSGGGPVFMPHEWRLLPAASPVPAAEASGRPPRGHADRASGTSGPAAA